MRCPPGRERRAVFKTIVDDADLAARCALEKSRAVRAAGQLSMVEFHADPVAVATFGLMERTLKFFEEYTRQTDVIGCTRKDCIVLVCPNTDLDGAMAMLTRLARELGTKFGRIALPVLASHSADDRSDREVSLVPTTCSGESAVVNIVHCGIQVRPATDRHP